MREAVVKARIELSLKEEIEGILHKIGINTTDAIRIFFNQIRIYRGIPYPLKAPNATTRQAIKDLESKTGVSTARSVKELFKKLKK
jgi:DNA-damage-inducible protein J